MNKIRFISLGVVFVLLLAMVVGSGSAADDDKFTIVIYNPVQAGFEPLLGGFLIQMTQFGYDSNFMTVKAAADSEGLTKALESGADLILSVPGEVVFETEVDLGDVPIIFAPARDPLGDGLVESLEQPGGNVTGVMMADLTGARFDLLLELVPDMKTLYVVSEMGAEPLEAQLAMLEAAASEAEVTLVMAQADFSADTVKSLPADIDAIFLLIAEDTPVGLAWPLAALQNQLPLIMESTTALASDLGPVMSYEYDLERMGWQAAELAAQILAGAAPGELPVVEGATALLIDLRIARAVGLEVSETLFEKADMVYEGELPPIEVTEPVASVAGACMAMLTHPGGSNAVCLDVPCDVPLDAGFIRYTERQPVSQCPTEGLIGTCAMEAFNMFHYDGEVSAVQRGCSMLMGEWIAP